MREWFKRCLAGMGRSVRVQGTANQVPANLACPRSLKGVKAWAQLGPGEETCESAQAQWARKGHPRMRKAWENWVTNEHSKLSLSHRGPSEEGDNVSVQGMLGRIKGQECP